jgi:hypothetical protein
MVVNSGYPVSASFCSIMPGFRVLYTKNAKAWTDSRRAPQRPPEKSIFRGFFFTGGNGGNRARQRIEPRRHHGTKQQQGIPHAKSARDAKESHYDSSGPLRSLRPWRAAPSAASAASCEIDLLLVCFSQEHAEEAEMLRRDARGTDLTTPRTARMGTDQENRETGKSGKRETSE